MDCGGVGKISQQNRQGIIEMREILSWGIVTAGPTKAAHRREARSLCGQSCSVRRLEALAGNGVDRLRACGVSG